MTLGVGVKLPSQFHMDFSCTYESMQENIMSILYVKGWSLGKYSQYFLIKYSKVLSWLNNSSDLIWSNLWKIHPSWVRCFWHIWLGRDPGAGLHQVTWIQSSEEPVHLLHLSNITDDFEVHRCGLSESITVHDTRTTSVKTKHRAWITRELVHS